MPSSFTVNKGIEQPTAGSYNNAWAAPVNADWADIDNAFGGSATINVTGVSAGSYSFALNQYQPPNIIFTGTLSGNLAYGFPSGVGGLWTIFNNTSGAFTLTIYSGGGGSFVAPQGVRSFLVCDGTNLSLAQSSAASGNPSALVGLGVVNGVAGTFMRSDGAPALDQSIAPTWIGIHTFANGVRFESAMSLINTSVFTLGAGSEIDGHLGSVMVPTQAGTDSSLNAASTAFVSDNFAPLASAPLSGSPTSTTPPSGNSSTRIATTAFVNPGFSATNNGHVILPSGIIIQWGNSVFSSGSSSITFSGVTGCIAFPNACFWAICNAVGSAATAYTVSYNATTLTAVNGISGNNTWLAIGN